MYIDRRKLLLGGIGSLAFPAAGRAVGISDIAGDVDVVVIGAGAAGLAAYRTLSYAGKTAILIEAKDRIGGRAHTTLDPFGVPFDRGAHWLHYGDNNPFLSYATSLGGDFSPQKQPEDVIIHDGRTSVCHGDCDEFNDAVEVAEEAIWDSRRHDQAISNVVDQSGAWGRSMAFSVGPWDMAKLLASVSTSDWSCTAEGDNYLCRPGYGALLANSARDIPVELSCTVKEIAQNKTGVQVVTDSGTIAAKACIVTVSNGVLVAERIKFTPDLSAEKMAAIEQIPMGHYARVALKFSTDIFGGGADQFVMNQISVGLPVPAEAFGISSNVAGQGIVYCDAGGPFAQSLESSGEAQAIDTALGFLRGMLGAKTVDAAYEDLGAATDWSGDVFTLGSYATANPGSFDKRAILRAPTEGRVFLAGEACDLDQWATVGGAHINGCETARNVVRFLNGEGYVGYGSCQAIFDEMETDHTGPAPDTTSCSQVKA